LSNPNWFSRCFKMTITSSTVRHSTHAAEKVEDTTNQPEHVSRSTRKRIWIDLDNTPHVPFFAPIIGELESRGYSVMVTARDAYQVCEVADLFHLIYKRVGRHYGKNKVLKVIGTCFRALQLRSVAGGQEVCLAVSHGSRSQILGSRLMRIPSLAIFDYEFTDHSAAFTATWLMAPEVIPRAAIRHAPNRMLSYHGIKEDVYAPTFKPDPSIRSRLGLTSTDVVVLLRPPATEAHYHNPRSETLFNATLEFLSRSDHVIVILIPRNARQAAAIRSSWPELLSTGKMRIPEHAEDGLNLIWHADVVISGGGTMNREAAALGVPVYSIFRGEIGAVDRYLAAEGRLTLLNSPEDLSAKVMLTHRTRSAVSCQTGRSTLTEIVDQIVAVAEAGNCRPGEEAQRAEARR
jgi:predicted glycosyltransferase